MFEKEASGKALSRGYAAEGCLTFSKTLGMCMSEI
jgi:hypothetical protein